MNRQPRRRTDFGLFMTGQVLSTFGSAITGVVLPIIAVQHFSATEFQMGILYASSVAPVIVLGFALGAWSDRQARKRRRLIMLDMLSSIVMAIFCVGLFLDVANFYWLMFVMLFVGIIALAAEALYFAHLETVIGEQTVMSARSRLIASERLGSATGRGASGIFVWIGGPALALVVDIVTNTVNALCLALIRSPDQRQTSTRTNSWRRDIREGFATILEIRILRAFSTFGLLISVSEAMVMALLPILLLRMMNLPEFYYGFVLISSSLAAAAGAWACTRMDSRMRAPTVSRIGLGGVTMGIGAIATGASITAPTSIVIVVIGLSAVGFFGSMWNVGLTTVVTESADSSILGRVALNVRTLTALASMAGGLLAGVLADRLGIGWQIWAAATICVAGATLMAVNVTGQRRTVDTAPAEVPDSSGR